MCGVVIDKVYVKRGKTFEFSLCVRYKLQNKIASKNMIKLR